jgi:hypothetical protein
MQAAADGQACGFKHFGWEQTFHIVCSLRPRSGAICANARGHAFAYTSIEKIPSRKVTWDGAVGGVVKEL